MLNHSASLAMSTSILKALPGKLDIKRHSPSILYLPDLSYTFSQYVITCLSTAVVTQDFKIITDSVIRSIICKGCIYRFPLPIDFKTYDEEIAGGLQYICNS